MIWKYSYTTETGETVEGSFEEGEFDTVEDFINSLDPLPHIWNNNITASPFKE
jgi:hypothetical protein